MSNFTPPIQSNKTSYDKPRIVFIGIFININISDQRYIAKNLGFEYIADIPFGAGEAAQMQQVTSIWTNIVKGFTKLIVLGDPSIKIIDDDITEIDWKAENYLFKKFKKDTEPIFLKDKIPVIMESELIKLHSEYPNITKSTRWEDEPKRINIVTRHKEKPEQLDLFPQINN